MLLSQSWFLSPYRIIVYKELLYHFIYPYHISGLGDYYYNAFMGRENRLKRSHGLFKVTKLTNAGPIIFSWGWLTFMLKTFLEH